MTMTYACMAVGDKDAESAAKGLLVNTRFPQTQPVHWNAGRDGINGAM